jgi:hypothetical protein
MAGTLVAAVTLVASDPRPSPAQTVVSNYPFTITLTGPEETVMTWGQWGIFNLPDGHLSYVGDRGDIRMWANGGPRSFLFTGPDFEHLTPPTLDSGGRAIPVLSPSGAGFDQGYAGAYAVVRAANGQDFMMVYHAEEYPEGQPSASNPVPCTRWGVGLARSSDGGTSWTRLGQIISSEQLFVPCSQGGPNVQGSGNPTVALSPDGQYFYVYYQEPLVTLEPDQPKNGNGVRVARAPVSSDGVPGSWQKYHNGNFSEPGLGGRGTPVLFFPLNPVVSFNTYLNRYVVVSMSCCDASTTGFVSASSVDGISWDTPTVFWSVPTTNLVPSLHVGDSWYHYPTFLSLDQPNQLTTGQTGYLYYAHGVVQSGNSYFRNLARRPVALVDGVGSPSLAMGVNAHTFRTGERLQVDITKANPGPQTFVDMYLGAVLPSSVGPSFGCPGGDAVAFITEGFAGSVVTCLSTPQDFRPVTRNVSLPAALSPTAVSNFFSFTWPAGIPAGTYILFVAFASRRAFVDGQIGPGEIRALATQAVSFTP